MSMYIRSGSCTDERHISDDCDSAELPCRYDHGLSEAAYDIRNVLQSHESGGGGSNSCITGVDNSPTGRSAVYSPDSCAMRSGLSRTLGTRVDNGSGRRKARTEYHLQMHLCLRGTYFGEHDAGNDGTDPIEGDDSV